MFISAFGTDFQVPTGMAAFLSKDSEYPHIIRDHTRTGATEEKDLAFLVAIATTETQPNIMEEENHSMSFKLDLLGWEKYFVDVREYIPCHSISLPSFMKKNKREQWQKFLEDRRSSRDGDAVSVHSKELLTLMTGSDRIGVPVGHQVMVANSKSESYSKFTENGRPVMDYLADVMVKSLLGED